MVALHVGSRPMIFVSSRSLAHEALIQNGAVFADRPPAPPTSRIVSCDQHNISSAFYGPTWRTLRRNLTAEILYPSRIKSFSQARKWVLGILLDRLASAGPATAVQAVDHFQCAMFGLLALMCFGDRLDERQIKEVEATQRALLLSGRRLSVINFWPRVGKILFRRRWEEFEKKRRDESEVLIPLIRARSEARSKNNSRTDNVVCYVDTLLNLELQEEGGKRKLTEAEIVTNCSEFLNGGTDTTATALEWIMANIVKHPAIQERLYEEIREAVGRDAADVEEEDLQRLPYLKAVVLEGLRRHPPGHFVLPHAVSEDTELGGFRVPKQGSLNFMVADIGWDPAVWEDPMEFRPERFLASGGAAEAFDITGTREIKMMPFGAGRRMCPGYALALLHLEYYVANLVWAFEWKAAKGEEVDLSEKQEFTVVMKNPLQAVVSWRLK
ncbi:hypothetical protein SAY86_019828 [Trapa natans]|uniref:Cytochrome P450 89A2 n=1 Tax=Trapa natans TaxID=22666 RepID=A0AAN7R198_TRANT|nr:hypothetical protein SAY86_019828 [Trapa natans]